ncbi:MAG: hypothetical protein ACE5H3_03975 [Planctomycetota bacterium]
MRIVFALVLLVAAAVCVFGFAATFEPLEPDQQLMWRIVYGTGALAALIGVVWVLAKGRRRI